MPECLREIEKTIAACRLCTLCDTRQNVVVWNSDYAQRGIMLIGEAPGADEDTAGEPFVGRAGQLLNRLLERAKMTRSNLCITNMLKCRPPGNRDPEPEELQTCRLYLEQQIAIINPRAIITLGRFAGCRLSLQYTTMGALAKRTDLVYRPAPRYDLDIPDYVEIATEPIPLFAAYHPSYILRQGRSQRAKELMEDTIEKFRRAYELAYPIV